MGVHLCYYKPDEYNRLSYDQKKERVELRNKHGKASSSKKKKQRHSTAISATVTKKVNDGFKNMEERETSKVTWYPHTDE